MSQPSRFLVHSAARSLCLVAALSLPAAAFAQTSTSVLDARVATSGKLTVAERLELVNIADPQADFTCNDVDSDNCCCGEVTQQCPHREPDNE